jgi:hypothetical protein
MYFPKQEEARQETGAAEPYFLPTETREETFAFSGAAGQNTLFQSQLQAGVNGKPLPHSAFDT